jgi:predicted secreted protein
MIDGTYNILYIDFGEGFLPVGFLTSNSLNEEIDFLDSTTRDNEGWKTQTMTNQSYSLEFEGLVSLSVAEVFSDSSKVGFDRLQLIKRNRQLVNWVSINFNNGITDRGKAQVTSLSSQSTVDEFMTFSANMQGFGEIINNQDLSGLLEFNLEEKI